MIFFFFLLLYLYDFRIQVKTCVYFNYYSIIYVYTLCMCVWKMNIKIISLIGRFYYLLQQETSFQRIFSFYRKRADRYTMEYYVCFNPTHTHSNAVYKSLLSIVTLEPYNVRGHGTPHGHVYTREHRKSTQVNQVGQAEHAKAQRGKKMAAKEGSFSIIIISTPNAISVATIFAFHSPPNFELTLMIT